MTSPLQVAVCYARGQMVWTTQSYPSTERPLSVTAFVDDIGIVSLDPHWLVRADALKP